MEPVPVPTLVRQYRDGSREGVAELRPHLRAQLNGGYQAISLAALPIALPRIPERVGYYNDVRAVIETCSEHDTMLLLLRNMIGLEADVSLEQTDHLEDLSRLALDSPNSGERAGRPEVKSVEARLRASVVDKEGVNAQRWPKLGFAADFGRFGTSIANNAST